MGDIEKIKNYIEHGVITDAFYAQANIQIWEKIGKNIDALGQLKKIDLGLFVYLQQSALLQMALRTARIYDLHNKYETRCLDGIFKKVGKINLAEIKIKKPSIKSYLDKLEAPKTLYDDIENIEKFLPNFINFCQENLINVKYKESIFLIKTIRDKYIAHNESYYQALTFQPSMIKELTDLAVDIATVIERCLIGDSVYFIKEDAQRSTYFVKNLIKNSLNKKSI